MTKKRKITKKQSSARSGAAGSDNAKRSPFAVGLLQIKEKQTIRILEVVFSDPESRNSLKVEFAVALERVLNDFAGLSPKSAKQSLQQVDAILFRSVGPVFCSGGNLRDHVAQGVKGGRVANRKIANVLERFHALPIPTIAVVEGDVFGGGIEFLSAFDFVFSTPSATFAFWQRRLGLSFGWGGGKRLESRLGSVQVAQLGVAAQTMTAHEALVVGLIDRVVAPWKIEDEALAFAAKVGSLPRASVAAMKSRTQKNEQAVFEKLWFSAAHRDALKKFN